MTGLVGGTVLFLVLAITFGTVGAMSSVRSSRIGWSRFALRRRLRIGPREHLSSPPITRSRGWRRWRESWRCSDRESWFRG